MSSHLRAELVASDQQVQQLRQVRNASTGTFSHDNAQISELAQRAWWVVNKGRIQAWLYFNVSDQLVGYGLVRLAHDGRWYNSIAVIPEHRGLGYGSQITADVLTRHHGLVWAQVRSDNAPSLAMHHSADWDRVEESRANLVTFRSKS